MSELYTRTEMLYLDQIARAFASVVVYTRVGSLNGSFTPGNEMRANTLH